MAVSTLKKQRKRLETTIRNAGPRYTPALNVEVSIAKIFDGLGRTFLFYDELKKYVAEFTSAARSYDVPKAKALLGDPYFSELTKECELLAKIASKIPNSGGKTKLPLNEITTQCEKVSEKIQKGFDIISEKREEEKKKDPNPKKEEYDYYSQPFREESNYLDRLYGKVNDLGYFTRGRQATAANRNFVLLRGEAGSGKTHFLCDLTKNRVDTGLPTFVFLGQEFNQKDPFSTILGLAGWTGTTKEFLDHLERNAAQKRSRAFIVIDAINEQRVKVNWSILLDALKKYKSICVILSVRTGFEFGVLPKRLRQSAFDVAHEGFADREWNALTSFFEFYNLEPDLPLLFPDFTNPLFLKIFCETYRDEGSTIRLRGHLGFTKVFEHYVVKQGGKVLRDMRSADLDAQKLIWRKTIKQIADYMVQHQTDRIPVADIEIIAKQVFPSKPKAFLQSLERNWLLLKNPVYSDKAPYGVLGFDYTFPYQKFSDHLIVRHLLSDSARIGSAKSLMGSSGRLEYIFANPWRFTGLIQALAVQIPERFEGTELISICGKNFQKTILAKDSFLHSLIWRDTEEKKGHLRFFKEKRILNIINNVIHKYHRGGHYDVLETLLTVTAIPKHPLNARLLSTHLKKFTLAKRDSFWLPFLYHKHNNSSSVDRIIHWALKVSNKTSYSDESLELVGIALAWFLSSSDRYIRDTATKAMIRLFRTRSKVLINVLHHFEGINDPYIAERLMAVAYGCALQSDDKELYGLGLYVYKKVFSRGKPPVHLLLRDYAKGTIERIIRVVPKLADEVDSKRLQPPYGSKWPDHIPTLAHLRGKYDDKVYGPNPKGRHAYADIWNSLMYNNGGGIADFGNYTVNSTLSYWSNQRLNPDGTAPKSRKQLWDDFYSGLNKDKQQLWDNSQEAQRKTFWFNNKPLLAFLRETDKFEPTEDDAKRHADAVSHAIEEKKRFVEALSAKERKEYKMTSQYVEQEQGKFHRRGERPDEPDGAEIQRWMFQKVLQLGWTPELFYDFDSRINERGRSAQKSERVGKKYQWIALHEILARLADNFAIKDGWSSEYLTTYKGPWDTYRRDIDPSHDLTLVDRKNPGAHWWVNKRYRNWQKTTPDNKWIRSNDTSELINQFICTKDPEGKEWLSLEGFYKWREPQKPGKENYSSSHEREVWLLQRAFIVKNKDADSLFSWARDKNYIGGWLPEPNDFHKIYLREFPDSTAYLDSHWDGKDRWRRLNDEQRKETDFEVLSTTESYMNESSTYDCSVSETVHVKFPSKEIVDGLGLSQSLETPAEFLNASGEVVIKDPSVSQGGENCVLVRKSDMLSFLKENDYSLVWAVMGEKAILSMDGGNGRLEFGGTYLMNSEGSIKGKKYLNFLKPHRSPNSKGKS